MTHTLEENRGGPRAVAVTRGLSPTTQLRTLRVDPRSERVDPRSDELARGHGGSAPGRTSTWSHSLRASQRPMPPRERSVPWAGAKPENGSL